MSERRTGLATVTITLEIETGSWGPECTLGQATKQAEEEARIRLDKILRDSASSDDQLRTKRMTLHGVRVVGVSKVAIRLVEDK